MGAEPLVFTPGTARDKTEQLEGWSLPSASRTDLFLKVLSYPHLPLHNNLSENDIREYARLRKISAGTRSDLDQRCRDTFLSIKKTCRKLGVSFSAYLSDRLSGAGKIPRLSELMRQAAANRNETATLESG